jgi:hypothetical protein
MDKRELKTVGIRLHPADARALEAIARAGHRTVSQQGRMIISEYIRDIQRREPVSHDTIM